MGTDLLYQGFRLGLGAGMGLLVCYLIAMTARELGQIIRMAGEWAEAKRTRKRFDRWAGREDKPKVRKIG